MVVSENGVYPKINIEISKVDQMMMNHQNGLIFRPDFQSKPCVTSMGNGNTIPFDILDLDNEFLKLSKRSPGWKIGSSLISGGIKTIQDSSIQHPFTLRRPASSSAQFRCMPLAWPLVMA